jgi:hypothetical protein
MAAKTKKHSSCSNGGLFTSEESGPTQLTTPLDPAVLSSFAVLRRAQTASDLIPPLSPVGFSLDYEIRSFYPAYVRRVATIGRATYYLVPALLREVKIPPARCLPPSLRRERDQYVERERKRASAPAYCIVRVGGPGGPDQTGCEPFDGVDAGARAFSGGLFTRLLVELVPDGVATVRISFLKATPMVVPTSENTYAFSAPAAARAKLNRMLQIAIHPATGRNLSKKQRRRREQRAARAFFRALQESQPTKVEWLGPSGALLRVIKPPHTTGLGSTVGIIG